MSIFDFNMFLDSLKDELGTLASEIGTDIRDELIKDGLQFVHKTRDDLQSWSEQLLTGELSKDDFEWLIKSKKDLAEMHALQQKGLAQARIDRFKTALVQTVIGSVTKMIP
jgi:hypothetical protein